MKPKYEVGDTKLGRHIVKFEVDRVDPTDDLYTYRVSFSIDNMTFRDNIWVNEHEMDVIMKGETPENDFDSMFTEDTI